MHELAIAQSLVDTASREAGRAGAGRVTRLELLGLDPLYVACEGRLVAVAPSAEADRAVASISGASAHGLACVIGRVVEGRRPMVTLRSRIGATRIVDMLSGEQLPRIC